MFFRKKPIAQRAYRIPEGERVYAVGDVHGCREQFVRLLAEIERDDAQRGPATTTLILLGDLVDRGPDSAGVVRIARILAEGGATRLVKGNHEDTFVAAVRGSTRAARGLLAYGGDATLRSYGISEEEQAHGDFHDLVALLADRIPGDDIRFLDKAERMIAIGDYLFVHAGIRPRVPLDEQIDDDLYWIRGDFLESKVDFGLMVIHGHTITDGVDERPNRIGVDTGAYQGGPLTAIGLEGAERWYLSASGDMLDGPASFA